MKRKFALVLAASAVFVLPQLAVADNANWSDEKAVTVDRNRNTDSGLGNGGERKNFSTGNEWAPTVLGETGRQDEDPGNAGDQCQGGKNRC